LTAVQQLNAELAVFQTARIGYSNALNAALPKESEETETKSKH
jgi:hypothetical protein